MFKILVLVKAMNSEISIPNSIKSTIDKAKEPFVIRNVLKWDILNWNLLDWSKELGDEQLQMRCGKNVPTTVRMHFLYGFLS